MYGQTGSGKTHTMGTDYNENKLLLPENEGIIQRAVRYLFDHLTRQQEGHWTAEVSFLEIYNESVFDLLSTSKDREAICIREGGNFMELKGVVCQVVGSPEEALRCLAQGCRNRSTGATLLNSCSSRSHAIFSIHLRGKVEGAMYTSKLQLVDLAGSEGIKRTHSIGDRRKEETTFDECASFHGDGWVALSRDRLTHTASNVSEVIRLSFLAKDRDGLLLFQGQPRGVDAKGQDYLSLALVNGYLEFSYEMGSGPAEIVSEERVDDGQLHAVELRRTGKRGTLKIDNKEVHGESLGLLVMLNTKSDIFIGGAPEPREMTAERYRKGFTGSVLNVQIQDSGVLNLYDDSTSSANADQCEEHVGSGDYFMHFGTSNK